MGTIPRGPEELSVAWLNERLRLPCEIESFSARSFGEGVGLMGQLVRLELRYAAGRGSGPATVVAKFPSLAEPNRNLAHALRMYRREHDYYAHLAPQSPFRTARMHYQDIDDAQNFVMIMEDVACRQAGDQIAGATPEQSRAAVLNLAKHHAHYWGRTRELSWLPRYDDPIDLAVVSKLYHDAIGPTLEALSEAFTPAQAELARALDGKLADLILDVDPDHLTVVHGDFRVDNLLFHAEGEPPTALDWQIVIEGCGTYDVGYHMSQSVAPEVRRRTELQLLRDYHAALCAHGVEGYGFETCLLDYRKTILFCLCYPVNICGALDLTNDRARALARMILDRSLSAIEDHQAGELLPG